MTEAGLDNYALFTKFIDRTNFGPGSAGQEAYDLIRNGIRCELAEGCNKNATATLDFDVRGDLVQILVCSVEHYAQVLAGVAKDLGKKTSDPTFSTNGWGRS